MLRKPAAGSGQRAERILLIRSGRHLDVAMDALRAHVPGCHIGVVGMPGSERAIADAGVAREDCFIYTKEPRFQARSFFFSATALRARLWRYDCVAILWNDRRGTGQRNVDWTALAMSPRKYFAIAPDGTLVARSLGPKVRRHALRFAASVGVGAVLGGLLYLPGIVVSAFRRTPY